MPSRHRDRTGPHAPVDIVIVRRNELVDFRDDLHPSNKVDVVIHPLSMLTVGKVVIKSFGGHWGHAFPHQNFADCLIQDNLRVSYVREGDGSALEAYYFLDKSRKSRYNID